MQKGAAAAPFRHRHLLAIEGLSPADIDHVLDLADGHAETQPDALIVHPGRWCGVETGGGIADNFDHPDPGRVEMGSRCAWPPMRS
jgi:hypothetical protein